MDIINILVVVSAVVVLLVLWIIVGVRRLKYLRSRVLEQWDLVDEGLRKRHDLLPNLLETVRAYAQGQEELVQRVIADRRKSAKEYGASVKKLELEHDLSEDIKAVFDLAPKGSELAMTTNFLELRTEIDDVEQGTEDRVKKYNDMVRTYNNNRHSIFLSPLGAMARLKSLNIFEFEA